ncbi:MAG: nuclear transport factor 2 family protein [Pseudomonas sp.]
MSHARDVQQVLAKYVRATDRRDATAMSALFMDNGRVEIFQGQSTPVALGVLQGATTIGQATAGMMVPHPARGWSHHTTHDPIIEVNGDQATIDVQFIVYNTVGLDQPASGWPHGAVGAQGRVEPIEAGYYQSSLERVDGVWKIAVHRITLDLPHAFPGA